ncbi:hypothetical protein NQ318_001605 [Aromia moschata]|uniref:Uncharacterized protein n=1 Tax=Aromia moschata TaxID=1265417 RepID=A0AAV8Y109_9CUCU|nr:hypothetical protein NQ318_001605 [Aromia moschata]
MSYYVHTYLKNPFALLVTGYTRISNSDSYHNITTVLFVNLVITDLYSSYLFNFGQLTCKCERESR